MRVTAFVVALLTILLSTTALADEFGTRRAETDVSDRAVADVPVLEGTRSEVPGLMNYQGTLTDIYGVALDTTISMTFTIYTDSTGGAIVWTETQPAVVVSKGVCNALLGIMTPITDDVFSDPVRWLGVQVGGDPELTPRQRIAAVGYAFRSAKADTADYARSASAATDGDWTIAGSDMYSAVSGNVGIGTTTPALDLDVHRTDNAACWVRVKSDIGFAGLVIDRGDTAQNGYVMYHTGGVPKWYLGQIGYGFANNDFAISTSWNPVDGKFCLTQAGNLGIGTSSPISKLTVREQGANELQYALRLTNPDVTDTGGTATGVLFETEPNDYGKGALVYERKRNFARGDFHFLQRTTGDYSSPTLSDAVVTIKNDGYVGIGTSSPAAKLDVSGDVNADSLYKIGGNTVLSTEGTENIFVGVGAGASNIGSRGTFVGDSAGYNNQGAANTFLGLEAGFHNTSGSYNTFLGGRAGYSNTTAEWNTFLGYGAGEENTEGFWNTMIGFWAGARNITGYGNTFLGYEAGFFKTTGYSNTFIGMNAGHGSNTGDSTGHSNTFIGYNTGSSQGTGYGNTYVGSGAGRSNTTGVHNVFLGYQAGYNETGSNKLYIANGSDPSDVLIYGDFSTSKVGIGTLSPGSMLDVSGEINADSLYKIDGISVLSTPGNTTLVGVGAGTNNTEDYGTFVGYNAGHNNEGVNCTFIGAQAGYFSQAQSNTFVGALAGEFTTSGIYNTFIGMATGRANDTGNWNTCLGAKAGLNLDTGNCNTFIGTYAGGYNLLGFNNVFLGYEAGYYEPGSNKLYIANGRDTSDVLIYGDFSTGQIALGTLAPAEILHLNKSSGSLGMRISSDASSYQYINFGATNGYGIGCDDTDKFFINREQPLGTGLLRALTIESDGDVGIGTKTPGYKLDVAGACHASSFPTSSDARLKTDVQQLTNVLDRLDKIRGVSFDWNEMYESMGRSTGHREIGVIAQEVEEQFPELVTTWGEEDYRAVDYGRLTGVLIEAVKELRAENRELREEIEAVKAEIR